MYEGCPHPEELCGERDATYPLAGLPDVSKMTLQDYAQCENATSNRRFRSSKMRDRWSF